MMIDPNHSKASVDGLVQLAKSKRKARLRFYPWLDIAAFALFAISMLTLLTVWLI